jgi:site-specific recombinase XerD
VQTVLRHESLATTQRYVHTDREAQRLVVLSA